ncbi:MAG: beta-ketoacyl-ACP synthase [Gammaproteobacteria bacterium]|jgi:beta-ketodecanoyl-[acyl-carrier-protein] synthase|nr:beta-ketoacyl-ACP synthase [Gammaproteobacteria bacterium]
MNERILISGTAVHTPPYKITNDDLVASFNAYVNSFNQTHAKAIANGTRQALQESSSAFIEKASGIKQRYVIERSGVLDIQHMHPLLRKRSDEELSIQCELALPACQKAMKAAGKEPSDIDTVILSASMLQRAYPAMAIELQNALGIKGFAFDMSMACSAATFAIEMAAALIAKGSSRCVLVVNPEIPSSFINFRDRDSHFIIGDVATALIVETEASCTYAHAYEIVDTKLYTEFSNNIRNNFGCMTRLEERSCEEPDQYFYQQGRKVFKEVSVTASNMILDHLAANEISPHQLKRLWLHQANGNMNHLIASKILGHDPIPTEAPVILDEYANTASAGSIVVFNKFHQDLHSGDLGILCSFGAGYSIGNLILRKR